MKRILCILIPAWPIQRLVLARPELEARPVVLYESYRQGHRAAVCSARAGVLGISPGMPLAEAKVLAGAGACFEPYDPAGDREALEALGEACRRFSPAVALDDSPAPDCLVLDVTGLAHLFGGEKRLASEIVRDFSRRRLAVRVAVADSLGAAWAVARFGKKRKAESGKRNPVRANPAPASSAFRFPLSAFFIVPSDQTAAVLRPLPIEALRLADDTVGLLHQLGVYQIGQLEPLDRGDLALRFGDQLVRRLDQAMGQVDEPLCQSVCKTPPQWIARCDLEHPTVFTYKAQIEQILEPLVGQVAASLARSGRGAVQFECRLICGRSGCVDLSVGLFRPSASAAHLFGLVRTRLDRRRITSPVTAVEVEATVASPLSQAQQPLFSDGPQELSGELAGLIDRLSSRLGRSAVVRPRFRPDAQPELACRFDPLVGESSKRRRRNPAWPERSSLPPRPLRLFARPVAVAAVSIVPDGPPLSFRLGGREHRIAWIWGPERIETGWWRGRPIGRDYYRIETPAGARYWLFRRLRDGKWFLHGAFE